MAPQDMPAGVGNGWAIEYAKQTNAYLKMLTQELHSFRDDHAEDMKEVRKMIAGCVSTDICNERRIQYGKTFVSQQQVGKIAGFFIALGGAVTYVFDLLKLGDRVKDVLPK